MDNRYKGQAKSGMQKDMREAYPNKRICPTKETGQTMTTSPYNNKTGEITGGFKPPFEARHYSGHTLSDVVDVNNRRVAGGLQEETARTLADILNEYCEFEKNFARLERECDEACKKLEEKNNPQHERSEG